MKWKLDYFHIRKNRLLLNPTTRNPWQKHIFNEVELGADNSIG